MKRCSGVLLPIFSLPSPYGIGTLGKAAYDWIDFLHEAGQQLWQVLPIGPTSFGDSHIRAFRHLPEIHTLLTSNSSAKTDCFKKKTVRRWRTKLTVQQSITQSSTNIGMRF